MRLQLDTYIALWAIAADPRLPANAAEPIADPANAVFACQSVRLHPDRAGLDGAGSIAHP
jgi:hypothetical protein